MRGQCEYSGCTKLGELFTAIDPDTGRLAHVCKRHSDEWLALPGREAVTDLEYRQRQAEVGHARR